jgi:hypothetical protein
MNRRLCVWVGSILGCLSFNALASGQVLALPPGVAPASGIPLQAENATDETPYLASINNFISDQLAALTGTDFSAQTAARQKLVAALVRGSTAPYYSAFAKSWSTACLAVIAKNPPLGVRLNIAIVTATLTDSGQPPEAEPLVVKLLGDREPVVILWAIRAAKPLIIVLIQNPPAFVASPLAGAIVSAVKKCGSSDVSGFVTTDAYGALVVKSIAGKPAAQVNPLLPPLVGPVLDILEFRIAQHAAGTVQSPGAERDIATWLSGNYAALKPADQLRMVQLLVKLETYAGQRCDLYQNDKKQLTQVREMLKYVASALKVIGGNGASVVNGLNWLTGMPPAAPPADIYSHTKTVFPTMNLVFPNLTAPPAIPVIAPPPPPVVKPATPAGGTSASPPAP